MKRKVSSQELVETGTAEFREDNMLAVNVDDWKVVLEIQGGLKASSSVERCGTFTMVHFDFPSSPLGEYHISVQQPFIDIQRTWVGAIQAWKGLEMTSVALNFTFESQSNNNLPVICNYNRYGVNRGGVGLLDQEPATVINQRAVLEFPPIEILQIKFSRNRKMGGFRETVVICRAKKHFADAVRSLLKFCRDQQDIRPLAAPDWGRGAVWCSWYSHLYKLTQKDVEEQIPLVKSLGFKTIIVDASWFQSKDNDVGCINEAGEYMMNKTMFPDFKELVARVHESGLKVMLWCAPIHLGVRSKNRDALLPYCIRKGRERWFVLCPFCAETKAHSRKIVGRIMRDYDIDGIKLDFIDGINPGLACEDPAHDHGDGNMGAAITDLLGGVRDEILKVRANAVIEYRVRYSNLATLSMANCHRGNDAPFDADYIRRENLFLRLFCEYPSAVWSDYAYWHEKEKTENISLMLGMQIFSGGVPTVSVDLPKCGTRQLKTMKSWLEFYNEHSDSLAKAGLTVNSADSMMSVTSLENRKSRMAYTLLSGQHVPAKIELKSGIREVWVLNASAEDSGEMEFTAGKLSALAKISGNLPIRVKLK